MRQCNSAPLIPSPPLWTAARETRSKTIPTFHSSKVNTNRPFGKAQAFDQIKSWLLLAAGFLNREETWGTGYRPSADEISFTLNTQTWPWRTLAWLITKAIPSTSQNRLTGALTLHFIKSWKCWDIDSICLHQAKRGQADVSSGRIL